MNHVMPTLRSLSLIAPLAGILAACGGTDPNAAPMLTETASERRPSSLSVTPTLEVAGLFTDALAEQIQVDEILINLSEVRMLGADPRIPAEGVALLTQDRIIRSTGGDVPAVELAFPEYLLDSEELAVFVRVGPSVALDGASVIIRGHYRPAELDGGQDLELAEMRSVVAATDPDVDPMDDPEPDTGPQETDCATDPDVDPMNCDQNIATTKGALTAMTTLPTLVPFELRDEQVVDLVASLGSSHETDVVLGIPASRWLTPTLVSTFEAAAAEAVETVHEAPNSMEANQAGGVNEKVVARAEEHLDGQDKIRQPGSCPSGYVLDGRTPGLPGSR